MFYEPFTYERFFSEITTEEDARRLIWHARFNGKDFVWNCYTKPTQRNEIISPL